LAEVGSAATSGSTFSTAPAEGGVVLESGQRFDEAVDLTRTENPHMTFGHGPHFCVGAQLARLELQEALTALLTRLPGLRLADGRDGVEWKYGVIVRGPARLPVAW